MLSGLEALADAIQRREGWSAEPEPTRSYRNRNPLNMRGITGYPADPEGFTMFPDLVTGYARGLLDLKEQFTAGENRHGLGPASTLLDLINVRSPSTDGNKPLAYSQFVAAWLTAALGRPVTPATTLGEIWAPGG